MLQKAERKKIKNADAAKIWAKKTKKKYVFTGWAPPLHCFLVGAPGKDRTCGTWIRNPF
jgi:hypothetical protein